jgi:ABC-type transport system substrate-binding protein
MNTSQDDKASEFIITYSSKPSSFDPLDFDSINNLNFARMIYATPLEFDSKGNLISNILDSFSYDEKLKILKFVVKKNIFFQNGERITADDLVLSIKRMLIKRPKFPVIEDIIGVDAWLNEATPLKKIASRD